MKRASNTAAAAVVLAVALGLAGCASSNDQLADDLAQDWQSRVVSVAELAAAGDDAGALVALDALQVDAQQALDAGDITAARAAYIAQSIELVRVDLQNAVAATPPPAPAVPEETTAVDPDDSGDDDSGNSGNGNGNGNDGDDDGDDKDKKDKDK